MLKTTNSWIVVVAMLLVTGTSHGQETSSAPAGQQSATDPKQNAAVVSVFSNDNGNYQDDQITYSNDIAVNIVDTGVSPATAVGACLPAYSPIIGRHRATMNSTGRPGWLFKVKSLGKDAEKGCTGKTAARAGDMIFIAEDDVMQFDPTRSGWAFGALIVPFKYHLRGDKTFGGGGTVGIYLGYRGSSDGIANLTGWLLPRGADLAIFGFGGPTTTNVKQIVDGKEKSISHAGFSAGLGVTATFKKSIQVGLVIGADHFGKDSNYVNNHKAWIAASIGFEFTQ